MQGALPGPEATGFGHVLARMEVQGEFYVSNYFMLLKMYAIWRMIVFFFIPLRIVKNFLLIKDFEIFEKKKNGSRIAILRSCLPFALLRWVKSSSSLSKITDSISTSHYGIAIFLASRINLIKVSRVSSIPHFVCNEVLTS